VRVCARACVCVCEERERVVLKESVPLKIVFLWISLYVRECGFVVFRLQVEKLGFICQVTICLKLLPSLTECGFSSDDTLKKGKSRAQNKPL